MHTLVALAIAAPSFDEPLRTTASAPLDFAVVFGIEEYFRLPEVDYARDDAELFADTFVSTLGGSTTRSRPRASSWGSREPTACGIGSGLPPTRGPTPPAPS